MQRKKTITNAGKIHRRHYLATHWLGDGADGRSRAAQNRRGEARKIANFP